MSLLARVVLLAVAVASSWWILRNVRRQRLPLGFSLIWLLLAVAIILLGLGADELLDPLASALGITYPPALLFLGSSIVLLLLCLRLAGKVAALDHQVRQVVERYGQDHTTPPEAGDAGADGPGRDDSGVAAP